jgi:hypothetical protein
MGSPGVVIAVGSTDRRWCEASARDLRLAAGGERSSAAARATLPGAGHWMPGVACRSVAGGLTSERSVGRCALASASAALAAPAVADVAAGRTTGDETVTSVVDTVADELFTTWGRLGVDRRWVGTGGRPSTFVPIRSGTAASLASSGDSGPSTYPLRLLRLLASDFLRHSIPMGWGQARSHAVPRALAQSPARADGGHDAFQD